MKFLILPLDKKIVISFPTLKTNTEENDTDISSAVLWKIPPCEES